MVLSLVEPVFVKNPQGVLDGARAAFENGFRARLNKITQWVYQRSAQSGYVYATHKVWEGQVRLLDKEMLDTSTRVEEACRYMLVKGLAFERARGLSSMLYIQTLVDDLRQKCQRLSLLLASEPYALALEYFKAKVAECSAIATKLKVEERVQALLCILEEADAKRAVIQEALEQEPAEVIEEAKSVYEDAMRFAAYTSRFFTLEVLAVYDLRPKIEALQARLGWGQEEYDLEPLPTFQGSMPSENYFRNGQWFATWSYIGYSQIASQIYALQNIAVALYETECKQNECVKQICQGSAVEDDAALEYDFRPHIEQMLDSLQSMVPSETVHAGWNYAVGLLSHSKRVLEQGAQLRDMRTGVLSLQVIALQKVVHFLGVKETCQMKGDRLGELKCLYEAAKALSIDNSLVENSFFALLKTSFDAEARRSLEYTAEEKTYSSMLLAGDAMWSYAPGVFQSYLMAGLLKQLYFGGVDQNFHQVLAKLKDDVFSKDGFNRCLEGSKECKELYEAVKK